MLHKTRGIVLHQLKYTDSSVIVHLYTEKFGRQAYIFSGIRSKKAKGRINYLQPLHLLDLEVYFKPKNNIQRIGEFSPNYTFKTLQNSIIKQTVLLFLAEILYKSLQEEESNEGLFEFLINSIQYFDTIEKGEADFHLVFLMQLTKFLGFYPSKNYDKQFCYFQLNEGIYLDNNIGYSNCLDSETSRLIYILSNTSLNEIGQFKISANERQKLLHALVLYYQHHISNLKTVKSIEVLETVFS